MVYTRVVSCLSSVFVKMSYFPSFFGRFESLALFSKMGGKPYTKAVKQDGFRQFFKGTTVNTLVQRFSILS